MDTKADQILLRVSEADKARIKTAATQSGKSLTTFVLEAAAKEASRIEKRPPARGVHGGVPSHFKGWCREAARGGSYGYEVVGHQFASSVGGEIPYDIEDDEWADEVEALQLALSDDDRETALEWFERHYPKMMEWIPQRRRAQFMDGVERAHEEGVIEA